MTSPTQRTLAALREQGYEAEVRERRSFIFGRCTCGEKIIQPGKTHDAWGFADVEALHPRLGRLWVQATSASNLAARVEKCLLSRQLKLCLRAGDRIEVWGWRKYAKPENGRWWRPKRVRIMTSAAHPIAMDAGEGVVVE